MLDQNTDRMWFVIGAVLIGAGLIAAANVLFPELFGSMSDSFKEMLGKATDSISGLDFNNANDGGATINLFKTLPPLF